MHKINYSWYLDLHLRWFLVCTQTILAVPKVAWVNLVINLDECQLALFPWLGFLVFSSAPQGATSSFLTHHYLLAFALVSLLTAQKNAYSGATCPLLQRKTNQRRTAELVTCFLDRSKTFIFAKAAVSRTQTLRLSRNREKPRLHGDLICKRLWVGSFVFPPATVRAALLLAHVLRATLYTLA